MSYTRKAFLGFAWVSIGLLLASLCSYLLRILLARELSVSDYGLVYSVLALFGLVSVFQHLGLNDALVRFSSQYSVQGRMDKIKEIAVLSLAMLVCSTAIVALLTTAFAPWLAAHYFGDPNATSLVRIFAAGFVLSSLGIVIGGLVRGRQQMALYAGYSLAQNLILLFATWTLLRLGIGMRSAMWAYLILYPLLYLLFVPVLASKTVPGFWRIRTGYTAKQAKALVAYGIPVLLAGAGAALLTFTDTTLLTILSGLDEVGIYQAALPTANVLLLVAAILVTVMMPLVSELWERGDKEILAYAIGDLYKYALLLILPITIATIVYPHIIINLLFGAAYVAAAPILQVLAIGTLLLTLSSINTSVLAGIGVPAENTKATIAAALVNVVLNLILIPRYGGLGAATATAISALLLFLASAWLVRRRVGAKFNLAQLGAVLVAGALFFCTLAAMRGFLPDVAQLWRAIVALLFASVVYALALFLLRAVTWNELLGMARRSLRRE
jgi:O-antigen/teichoic acid export membrane protein